LGGFSEKHYDPSLRRTLPFQDKRIAADSAAIIARAAQRSDKNDVLWHL